MAGITLKGYGSIKQISANLKHAIMGSGVSCNLVGSSIQTINEVEIHTLVFEKYYMRASNRVSLTVVLAAHDANMHATIIGAGGGQGALFSFSWGAEGSFEEMAEHILRRFGFK